MSKKLLCMLLVLSIILTMLGMPIMAQEENTTINSREEIIAFEPLKETEKTVSVGTSIEDLELPKTLRATVRTYPDTVTESVYDIEEETTVDIPVIWTAEPEYDMYTEGEYVFTPVIGDYVLAELVELPQIIVTVEAAMLREMISPMAAGGYDIWVAGVEVADENKNNITASGITGGKVTYDPDTNTLTLENASITYAGGNAIKTYMKDLIVVLYGDNTVTSTSPGDDNAFCTESGGSLTFKGDGSLEASGKYSGIYAFVNLIIESGMIKTTGQKVGISTNEGSITISGGNVFAEATTEGTRTCEGYGIAKDHNRDLTLTVSNNATVTAMGMRGAIGPANKITINTSHSVKAGDSESNVELVTTPDASTWEKPCVMLLPGHAISGTITDKEGSPIEGATVQLQKEGADFGDSVTTAADGTYTTKSLPDGNYNIKVRKSGYVDAVIEDINVNNSPVTGINTSLIPLQYTITAIAGTGGSISPSGSVTVNQGESKTFTITPNRNYSISDVKVDNVSQGKITSYTFSNVNADNIINAIFSYTGSSNSERGGRWSDDDRRSDRDSSSADKSIPVIVTPPAPNNQSSPTQGEIKEELPAFTDIENHWAKEDVEFVVRQGLFSGTSATSFSPDMTMTRAMFVTVLGRLANADISSHKESNFTDVRIDAYYMGYIEWAKLNNIINGVGNGIFAPNKSITREQMAVILQNYAKVNGFTLPKLNEEKIFADSDKISVYAKEAVQEMQISGIISGKDKDLFDPQGTATRAEGSAALRRFVEFISRETTN